MKRLRGVGVGAGYFAQFQYEAWSRMPEVEITALCDRDAGRAQTTAARYGVPKTYTDYREMLDAERPDFVDVITLPDAHGEICAAAAERGIAVICQKPLAPTFDESRRLVAQAQAAGVRLMVHDNFRFQPWHREIKRLLAAGAIGDRLHSLTFRSRPGDGWPADAYMGRQPYFRQMPRLLIHETGVHFIDTFRYLAGEIERVYCLLRKLNAKIAGEDCGVLLFEFAGGPVGMWDANRYNESNFPDPRYTFGEFLVEATGGTIRLYGDGRLTIQTLGATEQEHAYEHTRLGPGGDSVIATQRHFVERLLDQQPFETEGEDYLRTLAVQEACYLSAERKSPVVVQYEEG